MTKPLSFLLCIFVAGHGEIPSKFYLKANWFMDFSRQPTLWGNTRCTKQRNGQRELETTSNNNKHGSSQMQNAHSNIYLALRHFGASDTRCQNINWYASSYFRFPRANLSLLPNNVLRYTKMATFGSPLRLNNQQN